MRQRPDRADPGAASVFRRGRARSGKAISYQNRGEKAVIHIHIHTKENAYLRYFHAFQPDFRHYTHTHTHKGKRAFTMFSCISGRFFRIIHIHIHIHTNENAHLRCFHAFQADFPYYTHTHTHKNIALNFCRKRRADILRRPDSDGAASGDKADQKSRAAAWLRGSALTGCCLQISSH